MQLSEDQIIKLAPDAASVKAGKGLASAAKWVLRGASDRALWGHCQGSGKNPSLPDAGRFAEYRFQMFVSQP